MSLRRFVVSSAFLLAATTVSNAADQVTFQLGWLPGGDKAPAYLAAQQGMFAAENLDVKIVGGRGASDVLTKLVTGVADFGEVTFDVYIAAKAGSDLPASAVMPIFTKPPDAFVTVSSSGISNFKDMTGKTVGTAPFSNSLQILPGILKLNGVDPASVKVVKADINTLGPMLATGQVDSLLYWTTASPFLAASLKTMSKSMTLIPWSQYGFQGYSQIIVASDKMLKERPDVSRRFLKVMRAAIQKTYDDPGAAVQAVKIAVPQADVDAIRAQVDAINPLMVNEVTQRDGLGKFSPDLIKTTWQWVAGANNLPIDKIDPVANVDMKAAGF